MLDKLNQEETSKFKFLAVATDYLKSRSNSFWLRSILGLGVIGALAIFAVVLNTEDSPNTGTQRTAPNDLELSLGSPYTYAGITPDMPLEEAIPRLQASLVQYEDVYAQIQQQTLQRVYLVEAYRMLDAAKLEAQSGQFVYTVPTGMGLDLRSCPTKLSRVEHCILFRYMLEGLAAYNNGVRERDANTAMKGYLRFTAAYMALNPKPLELPTSDRVSHAMGNLLDTQYVLGQYLAPNQTQQDAGVRSVLMAPTTTEATEQSIENNTIPQPSPAVTPTPVPQP